MESRRVTRARKTAEIVEEKKELSVPTKKRKQNQKSFDKNADENAKDEPIATSKNETTKQAKLAPIFLKGDKSAAPLKKFTSEQKMNPTTTDYTSFEANLKGKKHDLKISSCNVAGIRAWIKKGGLEYILQEDSDIVCLQETKCQDKDLPKECAQLKLKYSCYWHSDGGFNGVALLSKKKPLSIKYGIGDVELDKERRVITAEYNDFYLVNAYVPNAGRGLVTLPKRLRWDKLFQKYLVGLKSIKEVVLSGDLNVAHNEIDLANPKNNHKSAGFTPEERAGLTKLLSLGFVDTFRHFYPDLEKAYTYWTYMQNCRAKNVGWRLDYFIVSDGFLKKVVDNVIRSEVMGSDHCPVTLFLNLEN